MTATTIFPAALSTRLSEHVDWLEALPKIGSLPGGMLYVDLLLFRATFGVWRTMRYWEKVVASDLIQGCLPEEMQSLAATCARQVTELRKALADLQARSIDGRVFRLLVGWLDRTVDEYSDVSETLAIGADPEIGELANQLHDAISDPRQPAVRNRPGTVA